MRTISCPGCHRLIDFPEPFDDLAVKCECGTVVTNEIPIQSPEWTPVVYADDETFADFWVEIEDSTEPGSSIHYVWNPILLPSRRPHH